MKLKSMKMKSSRRVLSAVSISTAVLMLIASQSPTKAFSVAPRTNTMKQSGGRTIKGIGNCRDSKVSTALNAQGNEKKKGALDGQVRSKLISESIAPWRTLRLFLYFALGSGAALGGLITLSGVAAALSGARTDIDLNAEYLNLGIDFGAVAAFAILAKFDLDKGNELSQNVEKKLEQKRENKVIRKAMKEREKTLAQLQLEIRVSEDGSTQKATVQAVQEGGKQHVIVVAGRRKAIRDALLGANILKMEFAMRDVLVVPYELDKKKDTQNLDEKTRPDGSGFATTANRPTWETQPYVAQPVGDQWPAYINAEVDDAIKQNGDKVKDDGIAIVVANTGQIIRRGVGQVPWREMVEELEKTVKEEDMLDLGFLSS